jgi:anti-anti-sigma regulatory factor
MSDDTADHNPATRLFLVRTVLPPAGASGEPEDPGHTFVIQSGSLRGNALDELGGVLERAMSAPHHVVRLDLSAVSDWSTLAQAMVLHTARVLRLRGSLLVLVAASEDLRLQSRWLDVFAQVDSEA